MALPSARSVRLLAVLACVPTAIWAGLALTSHSPQKSLARGPMIAAHADVACEACHLPSPGTLRQQIQAQVQYVLWRRSTPVDFGYSAVSSDRCLACHARPNERHPIYRFREPRFVQAVQQVDATQCLGCHTEHAVHTVSAQQTVCRHCHEDLKVENDPIERKHDFLILGGRWETCMACHDFHGNHKWTAPKKMQFALPNGVVAAYFQGGPDPYGAEKHYEATSE